MNASRGDRDSARRPGTRTLALAGAVLLLGAIAGAWFAFAGRSDDGENSFERPTANTELEATPPSTSIAHPSPTTTEATEVSNPAPATTTEPADVSRRFVIDPALCLSTYARESPVSTGITLFARSSPRPIPIQIIGDPDLGAAGPFALVERLYEGAPAPTGQTIIDLDGVGASINTRDNGNGQVTWTLADGTDGYIRSRGLDRTQLELVARTLVPINVGVVEVGFEYQPDVPLAGLELLHEQLSTEVSGKVWRSECISPVTDFLYRVTAAEGDPLFEFAMVIDQPAPLEVGTIDGATVTLSGIDDPAAPRLTDITTVEASD